MKRTFLLLVAIFLPAALAAQPGPSSYSPLHPCRFFDSRDSEGAPFATNSTHFFKVRGSCNVPSTANAVALTVVAFGPAANGHAKVWDSGILQPAASSFNFRAGPGASSSFLIPRLCYPVEECSDVDLSVYVSQETHIIIDVVGFTELLP